MIQPIQRTFTIPHHAGMLSGEVSIASWIFVPEHLDTTQMVPVLFCLPGGGFTKAYYHLPSHPSYSFAHHMTEKGFIVVAIDHLGTGESTHPRDGTQVTSEAMAHANHQTVQQLLQEGIAGIKAEKMRVIGIGHSMGAMLGIVQQSLYKSFDAFASLGWANGRMTMQVNEIPPLIDDHGYAWLQWEPLTPFLYGSFGVPDEIIVADQAQATCIPLGAFTFLAEPSAMERSAAPIACPIFIGNGTIDAAADLHAEAQFFPNSDDITIFRLRDSGHIHNVAPTRELLWDRLSWWAQARVDTTSEGVFSR